jgi:hypothetical protein
MGARLLSSVTDWTGQPAEVRDGQGRQGPGHRRTMLSTAGHIGPIGPTRLTTPTPRQAGQADKAIMLW